MREPHGRPRPDPGSPDHPPVRISVVGGGSESPARLREAEEVGRRLARGGAVVVCGGLGGVMEAVARGASGAGGWTVGVLPGRDPAAANRWITLPLATGMGEARNALVVRMGEAVIAVGGAWGTLSEIALARAMGVGVVTVGDPPAEGVELPRAAEPAEAVEWALAEARRRRGNRRR